MPLYEYVCTEAHISELVRPLYTEATHCPDCGHIALRTHRPARFDVVGPTVDTRNQFRRFQEASSEYDHNHTKLEESTGQKIPDLPVYRAAKEKAQIMHASGDSPAYRPLSES